MRVKVELSTGAVEPSSCGRMIGSMCPAACVHSSSGKCCAVSELYKGTLSTTLLRLSRGACCSS